MISFRDQYKDRYLEDSIYSLDSSVKVLDVNSDELERISEPYPQHIQDFITQHPEFVIAIAYEVYNGFLLSAKPTELNSFVCHGSGFNYGSANILDCLPPNERILILAQND